MANETTKHSPPGKLDLLMATLFALIALAIVVYVRCRLATLPLERDEGEYAYSGQLILRGIFPYLHAYTMKFPGMAYLNALFFACFGSSAAAIRTGLLLANIVSAFLLLAFGTRLSGLVNGLLAAGVFLLATLSEHLLGTLAHATQFVNLFVLAGYLAILPGDRPVTRFRYLLAGILFGCAILVKQHAAFFLLAAAVSIFMTSTGRAVAAGNITVMFLGGALPLCGVLVGVLRQGAFDSFWLWTVRYASQYATGLTPLIGWYNFVAEMKSILGSMFLYGVLALGGATVMLRERKRRELSFVLPLLVAAFAALCPGYYFRSHYFVLLAPAVALLAGRAAGEKLEGTRAGMAIMAMFFVAALVQVWQEGLYHLPSSKESYLKARYQSAAPFREPVVVADYLKRNTMDGDRIQVLGSEPQIYFYAGRLAASGYLYMYPLMEEHRLTERMQQGMLQELAEAKPAYVVLVDDFNSWLNVTQRGAAFRAKLNDFVANGYRIDGTVAHPSPDGEPLYVFGPQAKMYVPDSAPRILIFKRNDS